MNERDKNYIQNNFVSYNIKIESEKKIINDTTEKKQILITFKSETGIAQITIETQKDIINDTNNETKEKIDSLGNIEFSKLRI